MPELPEVRTVVKHLRQAVSQKTIVGLRVQAVKLIKDISVDQFTEQVMGQKIIDVSNLGKFIVFHFDNEQVMISHLRMVGKYRIEKKYNSKDHDHLIFDLNTGETLIYNDGRMFGTFQLRTKKDYLLTPPLNKLGKEPLNTNALYLHKKLQTRKVAIKSILLEQSLVVGLGNIYVNEVLWECKLDPSTPANKVSLNQLKSILQTSHDIMEMSTAHGGSTIENFLSFNEIAGGYQKFLKVHGRKNKNCPRCQNLILKKWVGGRGTFWCSHCQT